MPTNYAIICNCIYIRCTHVCFSAIEYFVDLYFGYDTSDVVRLVSIFHSVVARRTLSHHVGGMSPIVSYVTYAITSNVKFVNFKCFVKIVIMKISVKLDSFCLHFQIKSNGMFVVVFVFLQFVQTK